MKQIVLIGMAIYKESIGENIINLIFASALLLESPIFYEIVEKFDHDFDYQSNLITINLTNSK